MIPRTAVAVETIVTTAKSVKQVFAHTSGPQPWYAVAKRCIPTGILRTAEAVATTVERVNIAMPAFVRALPLIPQRPHTAPAKKYIPIMNQGTAEAVATTVEWVNIAMPAFVRASLIPQRTHYVTANQRIPIMIHRTAEVVETIAVKLNTAKQEYAK